MFDDIISKYVSICHGFISRYFLHQCFEISLVKFVSGNDNFEVRLKIMQTTDITFGILDAVMFIMERWTRTD